MATVLSVPGIIPSDIKPPSINIMIRWLLEEMRNAISTLIYLEFSVDNRQAVYRPFLKRV